MNIGRYIRDKIIYILCNFVCIILIYILFNIFNINKLLIMFTIVFVFVFFFVPLIYEYIKKKIFYSSFKKKLDALDKKYLITEMIDNANFLDGKLLLDYLYEIDKCMHEEINNYKYLSNEFKEYIELWCHEIKTPIATSKLIIENNKNRVTNSILEELDLIENYVETVLYYSRSDNVEKDYLIMDVNLKTIIDNVIKKNKKDFIEKKIKIEIDDLATVKSDSKWLEFIINQIIVNSIKYSKNKDSIIKVYAKKNKNNTILFIEDNGIGIDNTEIDRVFDKCFTGTNGRKKYNSTGIGLYLCKKLCNKLGHKIKIESVIDKYTIVSIIFPNNSMITEISNLTEM